MDERLPKSTQWAKEVLNSARNSPKGFLYWGALSSLAILLLLHTVRFFKTKSWRVRRQSVTTSTPDLKKAPNSMLKGPVRKPGGEFIPPFPHFLVNDGKIQRTQMKGGIRGERRGE